MKPERDSLFQVRARGKLLATLIPVTGRFRFRSGVVRRSRAYVLSRFAYCRRAGRDLILESPLAHARLILHGGSGAACLAELVRPCRPSDLPKRISGLTPQAALKFFSLLRHAGALSEADRRGRASEDRDPSLFSWEFHDLLFHSRSRVGRHDAPYGRTERFGRSAAIPPVSKPRMSDDSIVLPRPDIPALRSRDVPFTRVLEDRRSKRIHGPAALSFAQLGEFLYRSARIRRVFKLKGNTFTERAYPCSGAAYELELYPVIGRCRGVPPGLYHYEPLRHRLDRLSGRTKAVQRMLASAAATAHTSPPHVLIVLSARFQRVSLKYQTIAYASILKDVGALYQTFYLVATAMNLSPCALGVGDSDLFAEAAGLRYFEETSVGEFILGR